MFLQEHVTLCRIMAGYINLRGWKGMIFTPCSRSLPVIVSTFYYFSYEHKKHISEFDFFSFKRSDAQTTDFANFYES